MSAGIPLSLRALGLILATGLVGACATTSPPPEARSAVETALADPFVGTGLSAEAELPEAVQAALLPPLQLGGRAGSPQPSDARFDVSADRAPARQVFMSLVDGTPYDMVVHPDVSGRITLHLKSVTLEEALRTLRDSYGYDFRREGNRYYVMNGGLQSRMFSINYLNFKRKGQSNTHVSSGDLAEGIGQGSGGTNNTDTAASSGRTRSIDVKTDSEADFWKELKETLVAIVGDADGRSVAISPQANLVIVRGMPEELRMVEAFLTQTQSSVNRQVVLDAKIIEVELNHRFQAGINWAGVFRVDSTEFNLGQVGGGTLFSGLDASEIQGFLGNLDPGAGFVPINGNVTSAFGGMFSASIKGTDFAAFVELLRKQGDVNVLSSPRVSTINNQKAVIKVGGDEFFVTKVESSQVISGASTTVSPTVELTPFFSGVALDVTPQIDDAGNVTLHIHPTVSDVVQRNKTFVVGGDDFILPLAFSSVQESDNVVRARSGEIVVIGGLMKEASRNETAAVPVLGDLPIIGRMFQHKRVTQTKRELVILLKPTVVENGQAWRESLAESHRRVKQWHADTTASPSTQRGD